MSTSEFDIFRFLDKIKFPADNTKCWEWLAGLKPNGYAQFYVNGKTVYAHRVMSVLKEGEFQQGEIVRHTCDNRKCVRPSHLVRGSYADNAKDAENRGRRDHIQGLNHHSSKLTRQQVLEICASDETSSALSKRFPVSARAIRKIKQNKHYRKIAVSASFGYRKLADALSLKKGKNAQD